MADSLIQVPTDSTGKKVDTEQLTVGANTVERQRVQLSGAAAAEVAKVKNTAAAAADYGIVTRNVPRREGAVLSTAALGISGVFTQAWQDGNADGALIVQAVARADVASAASGFVIEETDDDGDANFTRTVAAKSVSANTTTFLYGVIRGRKWRVKYTNGGTAQTTFKITATSSVEAAFPADAEGQFLADVIDRDGRLAGRVKLLASGGAVIDPATDRATAAAPFSIRLSDGAAFYDAAKTGQLPAALVGGKLDVNIGATGAGITIEVVGDVAHDAAAAGNPVLIAARANLNEPGAEVADGDSTYLWADRLGRLVVVDGHANPEAPATVNATASGNTTVVAAPGASLSLYVKKGSVHNRGSTTRIVALQDGAGGTNRWRAELAPDGGGSLFDFGAHGWKLTANTLLNVNLDAAGDVDVNITDYYIAA